MIRAGQARAGPAQIKSFDLGDRAIHRKRRAAAGALGNTALTRHSKEDARRAIAGFNARTAPEALTDNTEALGRGIYCFRHLGPHTLSPGKRGPYKKQAGLRGKLHYNGLCVLTPRTLKGAAIETRLLRLNERQIHQRRTCWTLWPLVNWRVFKMCICCLIVYLRPEATGAGR